MKDSTGTKVQTSVVTESTTDLTLTDEALESQGLQKVTAYVRNKQSADALRKQRSREKAERNGLKQMNILLPHKMHDTIKSVAQELQKTGSLELALQNILAGQTTETTMNIAQANSQKPKKLCGWRLLLAKLLGLL